MDLSPLAPLLLVSCSGHSSVDTYTCYIECWSVVADTLVLILTPVTSLWCWSVVADTLVLVLTPVTVSVGQL